MIEPIYELLIMIILVAVGLPIGSHLIHSYESNQEALRRELEKSKKRGNL